MLRAPPSLVLLDEIPELNADALVWNHLETHGLGRRVIRTRDELKAFAIARLRAMANGQHAENIRSRNPCPLRQIKHTQY